MDFTWFLLMKNEEENITYPERTCRWKNRHGFTLSIFSQSSTTIRNLCTKITYATNRDNSWSQIATVYIQLFMDIYKAEQNLVILVRAKEGK